MGCFQASASGNNGKNILERVSLHFCFFFPSLSWIIKNLDIKAHFFLRPFARQLAPDRDLRCSPYGCRFMLVTPAPWPCGQIDCWVRPSCSQPVFKVWARGIHCLLCLEEGQFHNGGQLGEETVGFCCGPLKKFCCCCFDNSPKTRCDLNRGFLKYKFKGEEKTAQPRSFKYCSIWSPWYKLGGAKLVTNWQCRGA